MPRRTLGEPLIAHAITFCFLLQQQFHSTAVSTPPCVHTEDWCTWRAAGFFKSQSATNLLMERANPLRKAGEEQHFHRRQHRLINAGSRWQRVSLKAVLPFQAETQLHATVLAGGSGASRLHHTSLVYTSTATYMTSWGAARCCFACGSVLGLPLGQVLAPSPYPLLWDLLAPLLALLSSVLARRRHGCPKITLVLHVLSAAALLGWLSISWAAVWKKVLSGAGCCSVQSSLLLFQAQLQADHGNLHKVSAWLSLGSSALVSPPDCQAIASHCCV